MTRRLRTTNLKDWERLVSRLPKSVDRFFDIIKDL